MQVGDTVWATGFLRVEPKRNREGEEFLVLNLKASAFEIVNGYSQAEGREAATFSCLP